MGIFKKLFAKKGQTDTCALTQSQHDVAYSLPVLTVHPDLKTLLWIMDGPHKNYVQQGKETVCEYGGIKFTLSSFSMQEPSAMSVKLPILENVNPGLIERPPYYPTYSGLTEEQRGVYWKFLANPYSGNYDIGYVFLLYYGLERHLMEGNCRDAFHVILKLRDVYDNKSFQAYSACAIILMCLIRQQPDLAEEFYKSLDKDYKLCFSDDLFLLCKLGLKQPIRPRDLMRMSKSFDFTNQNYIKKYPDLFEEKLSRLMEEQFEHAWLELNQMITQTQFSKTPQIEMPVFANVSISDKAIKIPQLTNCFQIKRVAFNLLEEAHQAVKQELAARRKAGTAPAPKEKMAKKIIELPTFDSDTEKVLLEEYQKSAGNALDKHFSLISLQKFYYKYRELDEQYLEKCIEYCMEDISLLPQVQQQYVQDEESNIQAMRDTYGKAEIEAKIQAIQPFMGIIPAFKRMAIIYEKQRKYTEAISICNQAMEYYQGLNAASCFHEFAARKEKLEQKINK